MGKTYGSKKIERDFGRLTFGKALWAYRKGEDIPKKDLALLLGISPQSLYDLEKGRKIPSSVRTAHIARQLGQSEKLWSQLALQDRKSEA